MSTVKINPQSVQRIVDRLVISRVNVILFKQAHVFIDMFHGDQLVQQANVILSEDEYAGWGADDKYILHIAATKLGFDVQPVEFPQST